MISNLQISPLQRIHRVSSPPIFLHEESHLKSIGRGADLKSLRCTSKINAGDFVMIHPLINQIRRIHRTTSLQTPTKKLICRVSLFSKRQFCKEYHTSRGLVTFIGDNRHARRSKTTALIPALRPTQQAKIRSSAGIQATGMVK